MPREGSGGLGNDALWRAAPRIAYTALIAGNRLRALKEPVLTRVDPGDTLLSAPRHSRRFTAKQESNLGCHLSCSEDVA